MPVWCLRWENKTEMGKKVNLKDVLAYLQGHLRYRLYYSRWFSWLLPGHIREQIGFRIGSMDRECYERGSCVLCGCATTALQMADKACDKPCYPWMVGWEKWTLWRSVHDGACRCAETGTVWKLDHERGRFVGVENGALRMENAGMVSGQGEKDNG